MWAADEHACYLSSSCFRMQPLADVVRACGARGVRNIELSAPHPHQPVGAIVRELDGFRAEGYRFCLHNYFPPPERSFVLNLAAATPDERAKCHALIDGARRIATAVGSPVYGLHAGYLARATETETGAFAFADTDDPYDEALDRAVAFVNAIAPAFAAAGVTLLLENLFPARKRRHSLFCTLAEIDEFMARVPESVGLLLDLGHLNVAANLLRFDRARFLDQLLDRFADRLGEIHISENDGEKDDHLPLRPGSWQLGALADIRRAGPAGRVHCLEARNATLDELVANLSAIDAIIA